jgi:hypothetical protein
VIAGGGGSNLYPPEDFVTFTPEDIQERIQGSKIVIVSEQVRCKLYFQLPAYPIDASESSNIESEFQAMLCVIYAIKACMLIMYTRLTLGLHTNRLVYYLAAYVAIGWVATEIAFFTACRPFSGYWAMPPPISECSTLAKYAITQACFNISSDALMLCIPLPLITKLAMPWKQKAILLIIFSMGVFVILAAILTKVFNLSNIWDPLYMLWYTREASVAVYVSNLPMIWPLLRELFPILKQLTPGQKDSSSKGYHSNTASRKTTASLANRNISGNGFGERTITTTIQGTVRGDSTEELRKGGATEMGVITRHASWEYGQGKGPKVTIENVSSNSSYWESDLPKGAIHMSTTVHVSEEHVEPSENIHVPQGVAPVHDLEKGKEWGI